MRVQPRSSGSLPNPNIKLPVWDFVLHRQDGTGIRLHPQWSKSNVESYDAEGHAEPVDSPRAGHGRSDGPGTYRYFKAVGTNLNFKFDTAKRP